MHSRPAADRLFRHVEVDFAREALLAPALYPEHVDAPFLDAAAVGRWLARYLPRLDELRLELRHSRWAGREGDDSRRLATAPSLGF